MKKMNFSKFMKRIIKHLIDKANEKTYKELWEKQNIMLDQKKLEYTRLLKKYKKLELKLENGKDL